MAQAIRKDDPSGHEEDRSVPLMLVNKQLDVQQIQQPGMVARRRTEIKSGSQNMTSGQEDTTVYQNIRLRKMKSDNSTSAVTISHKRPSDYYKDRSTLNDTLRPSTVGLNRGKSVSSTSVNSRKSF